MPGVRQRMDYENAQARPDEDANRLGDYENGQNRILQRL